MGSGYNGGLDMYELFKNPEFRSTITMLLLCQIIFAIILFSFTMVWLNRINEAIVEQNAALTGQILSKYPQFEDEIMPVILKGPNNTEISKGQEILKRYGYNKNMGIGNQPLLKGIYLNIQIKVLLIAIIYFIPIFFLISREHKHLYSKIQNISHAAEQVVKGDFSLILPEDEQGEIGILNHQFNQMANRIKLGIEQLSNEKIFLKNIISDISHQLKTPLSSLIMFNELMLEDRDMDDDVGEVFLKKSKTQLERMEWLTISLLKMARLEAGAIQFKRECIYLIEPVDIAIATLNPKVESKHQLITLDGEIKKAQFLGDRDWTAEAIINILKNCIEHTEYGGNILISIEETPIFSRIIIKDSGEGIDRKDLPHIFERFYKGTSTVKTESVGIGLALSKLIIESQGGTISVKSKKHEGTKFTITFLKGII